MKCLKCGYCCLNFLIVIIKEPKKGIVEGNLEALDGTKRCPHLIGNKPGEYSCSIHHYDWFKDTPCGEYSQVERQERNCRTGDYIIKTQRNHTCLLDSHYN